MNRTINDELRDVRQQFFPRWDRAGRWRVRQFTDLDGAQGRCCREDRTIRVTPLQGEEGVALLIHEIAHAVATDGHGRKWQARMEQAAVTADQLGRSELAGLLRKETAGYNDPLAKVTAAGVYGEITDAVVENPGVTFWQVIDCVRRDYGCSRKEFLKHFRRAKVVFDREREDAEEAAKARAAWMAADKCKLK
jgi:hypothetical protein